jgi:hypothetical protein
MSRRRNGSRGRRGAIIERLAERADGRFPRLTESAPASLPSEEEIDGVIQAALHTDDPVVAFDKLLDRFGWTRRAWADDAAPSEPTVSRFIRRIAVPRSEKALRNALRQRLRERWPSMRGAAAEKSLKN